MKRIPALLLFDWRRKLIALGIAFLLWSWIEGRIAVDREVVLTVAFSNEAVGTPNDFELMVQAPEGWVLTEPMVGSPVSIPLRGSESELQSFTNRQCAASFVANFQARSDQAEVTVPVSPTALSWLRPGDAALLLEAEEEIPSGLRELKFERVKTSVRRLESSDISVQGNPSPAHVVLGDALRFEPDTISLTGPQSHVDSLIAALDASGEEGLSGGPRLLSVFHLPEGTRVDSHRYLDLNTEWQRRGIRMDPSRVHVFATVRLKDPIHIRINPAPEQLHVLPADDEASNGPWDLMPWEPGTWIVEMPHIEASERISESWVRDHVQFFLPMNTLTSDSLDGTRLRVEAHLVGLTDTELQQYLEHHLIIRPETALGGQIEVSRRQP